MYVSRSERSLDSSSEIEAFPSASRRPMGLKSLGEEPVLWGFNNKERVALAQGSGGVRGD